MSIHHSLIFTVECDCGPKGKCSFENGLIKCICEEGFIDNDGICTGKKD